MVLPFLIPLLGGLLSGAVGPVIKAISGKGRRRRRRQGSTRTYKIMQGGRRRRRRRRRQVLPI